MSSLPFLSHRLFVAAVAPADRRRRQAGPPELPAEPLGRADSVVALEVLDRDPTADSLTGRRLKPALAGAR